MKRRRRREKSRRLFLFVVERRYLERWRIPSLRAPCGRVDELTRRPRRAHSSTSTSPLVNPDEPTRQPRRAHSSTWTIPIDNLVDLDDATRQRRRPRRAHASTSMIPFVNGQPARSERRPFPRWRRQSRAPSSTLPRSTSTLPLVSIDAPEVNLVWRGARRSRCRHCYASEDGTS